MLVIAAIMKGPICFQEALVGFNLPLAFNWSPFVIFLLPKPLSFWLRLHKTIQAPPLWVLPKAALPVSRLLALSDTCLAAGAPGWQVNTTFVAIAG